VGLITGLITLPLAPVRATSWIAEQALEQAEREQYDEGRIRDQLIEVDELLERLMAARELGW
jgi:Gas vesicle protein G